MGCIHIWNLCTSRTIYLFIYLRYFAFFKCNLHFNLISSFQNGIKLYIRLICIYITLTSHFFRLSEKFSFFLSRYLSVSVYLCIACVSFLAGSFVFPPMKLYSTMIRMRVYIYIYVLLHGNFAYCIVFVHLQSHRVRWFKPWKVIVFRATQMKRNPAKKK